MIDFVLLNQKIKQALIDSRSYGGTLCSSNHKLVVSRMNIRPFIIHKKKSRTPSQVPKFNTELLTRNKEVKDQHQKRISELI